MGQTGRWRLHFPRAMPAPQPVVFHADGLSLRSGGATSGRPRRFAALCARYATPPSESLATCLRNRAPLAPRRVTKAAASRRSRRSGERSQANTGSCGRLRTSHAPAISSSMRPSASAKRAATPFTSSGCAFSSARALSRSSTGFIGRKKLRAAPTSYLLAETVGVRPRAADSGKASHRRFPASCNLDLTRDVASRNFASCWRRPERVGHTRGPLVLQKSTTVVSVERNLTAHEPHSPLPCLCSRCLPAAPELASTDGLSFHRVEAHGGGRVLHAWVPDELKNETARLQAAMGRRLEQRVNKRWVVNATPASSAPAGLFSRLRRFLGF